MLEPGAVLGEEGWPWPQPRGRLDAAVAGQTSSSGNPGCVRQVRLPAETQVWSRAPPGLQGGCPAQPMAAGSEGTPAGSWTKGHAAKGLQGWARVGGAQDG